MSVVMRSGIRIGNSIKIVDEMLRSGFKSPIQLLYLQLENVIVQSVAVRHFVITIIKRIIVDLLILSGLKNLRRSLLVSALIKSHNVFYGFRLLLALL